MANATHVVVHPKLNLAVNGKLQRLEVGTELTLDAKTAERLGKKVKPIGSAKSVDVVPSIVTGKQFYR